MAVVRLENIGKRYGGGAPILGDVSLELQPGGFYFLTGTSGVGKTTLLRIIYLAEEPSRGKLTLFDRDAATLDRAARTALRRRIGIVFQDFRLIDELSARENVALPLRVTGAPEQQINDNVAELLRWVGLSGRIDALAATLSGGERQRVAIARAIIRRPELLIADEPTGNVDDDIALLLVRVFERINRLGTTVLIATHDIAFARQFEHRRYHLDQGMLLEAGTSLPQ
ncbi:MAG TPA: ATP-binding cassette domain-containing protein [Stellaceae bacterium]|nr:ATP-binding cassette domain-containing protein [Stellaceae bacterium]